MPQTDHDDDQELELDAGVGDELDVDESGVADRRDDSPAPAPAILLGQRVFCVGGTGTGKSEAALNLFAVHTGQRLLVDVQDHYVFGPDALAEEPPPLEVDDSRAIDWAHRTIRYVPRRAGDRMEMDKLHAAIFRRGHMLVVEDELEDIAPSQGGGASFYVRKTYKQGRKVRLTMAGTTQRPVGVDRAVRDQAEHMLVFPLTGDDDLNAIRRRLGMTVDELSQTLAELGPYEYLHHVKGQLDERRRPLVLAMPALPPATIEFTRRHIINEEFK